MQITFNPASDEDRAAVLNLLETFVAPVAPVATATDPEWVSPYGDNNPPVNVGVDTDVNGTPWIADVHAGSKGRNKDGSWRAKRGVDKATLEAAEEAARLDLAATPEAPDLPPVKVEQETVPPIEMTALISEYTRCSEAGLISATEFLALYEQYNTSPQDIATNETARAQIYAHLQGLG